MERTHNATYWEGRISHYLEEKKRLSENRKALEDFNAERAATNSPPTTRFLFIWTMQRLDKFFGYKKPFKEMTKDEIVKYWSHYSYLKSNSERKAMKVFFQWLFGLEKGKYPECVAWINFKSTRSKLPEEMLNKNEIAQLISSAPCLRDRCLIALLYESGARAGEIINLRLKDIEFQIIEGTEIGTIRLNGKTGARQVLIRDCIPLIKQWLNEHPLKNDRGAPLFMTSSPP